MYKAHLPNYNNSFNVGGSGYFAYGVGGKITGPINSELDTFGDNGLLNRPDIGLTFELQFEMPKLIFNYGVELGLAKIMKRDVLNSSVSINNWGLYFGAGYKF